MADSSIDFSSLDSASGAGFDIGSLSSPFDSSAPLSTTDTTDLSAVGADSTTDFTGGVSDVGGSLDSGSDLGQSGFLGDLSAFELSPPDSYIATGQTDAAPDPYSSGENVNGSGSADAVDSANTSGGFDWSGASSIFNAFGKFGAGLAGMFSGNPVQYANVGGTRVPVGAAGTKVIRPSASITGNHLTLILLVFGALLLLLLFGKGK